MIDYILEQLKKLTAISSPTGYTLEVTDFLIDELSAMGFKPYKTKKGCVVCDLGGEENPLIVAGHVDTLGGMVQEVKSNGRLKLTKLGGLKASNCQGENVVIITRDGKRFDGTFMQNNPSVHVNADYDKTPLDFDNMEVVVDEKTSSKEQTLSLGIEVGDIVAFDPRTTITPSGFIKSRFLDDKLSVAIFLALAKEISQKTFKLNRKVTLFITVYEEVGHGACGAMPSANEILAVDMGCVGDGLTCTEHEVSICVKDGRGPSDFEMTSRLINLAKANNINYAVDVYPFYGSDADAALSAGYDIKHALIGSGVYASHGYERAHTDGVKNTYNLLKAFVG